LNRVGITQRLVREEKYDEIRNALDIRWQDLLLSIDLIPIPLPINVDLRSYNGLELNGIILTGGNDLFSQTRNELSILRDKHENQCIEYAIEKSIPIFGVCRGMQLIAEYFGSSFKKIDNHVAKRHKIISINEHVYKKYFNKIDNVNSYHTYAIDILGDDLNAIGICPDDNVIEAIVHKKYKIFGQMWHPEREKPFDLYNCQIISSFFNA
jgi:N5-(cytidine 5'-diphosphoramidyl)-L-glutamine hydrolase